MTPRILFSLILCNLIWSANPAMGKLVLADLPPSTGAWLRYSSAALAYVIAMGLLKARKRATGMGMPAGISGPTFLWPDRGSGRRRTIVLLFAIGFMGFCFAPLLQMRGLSSSRATDNALIVAMEPLITVAFAWIFLRERPSKWIGAAFALAILGFGLLTDLTPARVLGGWDAHLIGNLLMLIALTGEATYSVVGRLLLRRHAPAGIFGSAIVIGSVLLTVFILFLEGSQSFAPLSQLGWKSLLAILWLGPIGTAAGYLYWMIALTEAPVAAMALTLFIQPVCGALWGYLFLGDRLSFGQGVGAAFIILAILAQSGSDRAQSVTVPTT